MAGWSKEKLGSMVLDEFRNFHSRAREIENSIKQSKDESLEYLRRLISQAAESTPGPLLLKTPKVNRGRPKNTRAIETIHEDEPTDFDSISTTTTAPLDTDEVVEVKEEESDSTSQRPRRTASTKAVESMKRQQSLNLREKLRQSSPDAASNKQIKRASELKNKKKSKYVELSSSEDENTEPVRETRRTKVSVAKKKSMNEKTLCDANDGTFVVEVATSHETKRVSTAKRKLDQTRSPSPAASTERDKSRSGGPRPKRPHIVDESPVKSDNTLEASIYEDALGKPAPIHNSTKIGDTTVTVESKSSDLARISSKLSYGNINATVTLDPLTAKDLKEYMRPGFSYSDDEVGCTPEVRPQTKNALLYENRGKVSKQTHKPNPLFSPYATDSVKKRVQAFEQVTANSPQAVDIDAPGRLTRTKTRAIAAAAADRSSAQPPVVQSLSQKLARKSLAKAKKISLVRQMKDQDDDYKENGISSSSSKPSRIVTYNEKLLQKQQLRTTPIGKSRLQQPISVGRAHLTPSNMPPLSSHSKALSASRGNVVMHIDSFLPSAKQIQKANESENREDRKRKANDEDARKKRDEALKAVIEEKRRKREIKELKNKLAREAKEKLDMEKRLKAEKEREEKAKAALQLQEKQREEAEKKRLLQLQRAQEKEERRRQEEQLRLQRLREQEETERQLAEQKRKEQELEKQHQRRLAEAKAQEQAAAETAKTNAYAQAKAKQLNNTYNVAKQTEGPSSYKMDSEPDEASDNESAPKHEIPYWAKPDVRKKQLILQEYIPDIGVFKFFGTRQCTPDLTQIFEGIDKKRLARTSSAIWKKPPRASMFYAE